MLHFSLGIFPAFVGGSCYILVVTAWNIKIELCKKSPLNEWPSKKHLTTEQVRMQMEKAEVIVHCHDFGVQSWADISMEEE